MRKFVVALILGTLVSVGGCRAVNNAIWKVPKWIDGKILNVYTGNGHYDGAQRWDNVTKQWQQIWNVVDIYFFNYDVTDPFVGTPFFGDPR